MAKNSWGAFGPRSVEKILNAYFQTLLLGTTTPPASCHEELMLLTRRMGKGVMIAL